MCVCVLVLKNLVDRLQFSQSIKSRNKNTQTHAQPMTYRGPRQSKNHFFLDSFNSAQGVAIRGDNMIHPDECIFMCFSTHSVLPYLSQFSAFRFGVRQQHTITHSPVYCLLFTSLSTYTRQLKRERRLSIYLFVFIPFTYVIAAVVAAAAAAHYYYAPISSQSSQNEKSLIFCVHHVLIRKTPMDQKSEESLTK